MSERGSFITSYMYCRKCFEASKVVLLMSTKYLCSVSIPTWDKESTEAELPIIAGKVGGLYSGEELDTFREELIPALRKVICHPMIIAVLAEKGEEIFFVDPE